MAGNRRICWIDQYAWFVLLRIEHRVRPDLLLTSSAPVMNIYRTVNTTEILCQEIRMGRNVPDKGTLGI
jgi:hypothetical protein